MLTIPFHTTHAATFANGRWETPSETAARNGRETVEEIKRLAAAGARGVPDTSMHRVRCLEPHLQRDTFSGGVNRTRRERNIRRIRESLKLYRIARDQTLEIKPSLHGSVFACAIATEALGGDGCAVLKRHCNHPAAAEWWELGLGGGR